MGNKDSSQAREMAESGPYGQGGEGADGKGLPTSPASCHRRCWPSGGGDWSEMQVRDVISLAMSFVWVCNQHCSVVT